MAAPKKKSKSPPAPPPPSAAPPAPPAAELVAWENIRRYGTPGEAHEVFAPLAGQWEGADAPMRAEGCWILDRRFLRLQVIEGEPGALRFSQRQSVWFLGYDIIQRRHTAHCLEAGGRLLRFQGQWDRAAARLVLASDDGARVIAIGPGAGFSIQFDGAERALSFRRAQDGRQGAPLEIARREPDRAAFGDRMIDWEGEWHGPARRLMSPGGRVIESPTAMRARFIQNGRALLFEFESPLEGFFHEFVCVIAPGAGPHDFAAALFDNFGSGVFDLAGPWDEPARVLALEGGWSNYLSGRREPARMTFTRTLHGLLVIDLAVPDAMGRFERFMNVALLRRQQGSSTA